MKVLERIITLPSRDGEFRLIPFGCFAPDTEILTREGWKRREQLHEGLEVMTFNTATNAGEWQPIKTLIDHSSGVYPQLYFSPSHEFLITPDHRIWYQYSTDDASCWRRRVAQRCPLGSSPTFRIPVSVLHESKGVEHSHDLLRLLGWFIAEGSFSFDRRNKKIGTPAALLSQNEVNAPPLLALLQRLGISCKVYRYDRRDREWVIAGVSTVHANHIELTIKLPRDWAIKLWDLIPNKQVPLWLYDASPSQFEAFFDAIVDGDGHWNDRGRRGMLYQKDKTRLDHIQALCVMHGYKTKLSMSRKQPVLWRLTFRKERRASLHRPLQVIEWDGPVWCLTVQNESVVVRRNGRPVILSNCLHADSEGHRKALWDNCKAELLKPNTYGIGAGDYRDLLRTTAMRYLQGYRQDSTSMKTLDDMVRESTIDFYHEYFKGLEAKIIGLGKGNHLYQYQNGTNDNQQLCQLLNVPYLDNPSFIRLVIRTPDGKMRATLRVLMHHGNWGGGSSRPGGSVNVAEMKAAGFDFDIYIFSHDHRKWAMHIPTLTIPRTGALEVIERPRCFIRTGCFVAGYDKKCGDGNYVQDKLMHPSDLGFVTLTVKFYREYDSEAYKRRRIRNPNKPTSGSGSGRDRYKFSVTF